jgi:alpha-tubulin suppressor-like RCC1 family protein
VTIKGRDVYVWGQGDKGQLGRGDTESQPVPRLVIALRDKLVCKISCGSEHTLALTSAGVLYAFGMFN